MPNHKEPARHRQRDRPNYFLCRDSQSAVVPSLFIGLFFPRWSPRTTQLHLLFCQIQCAIKSQSPNDGYLCSELNGETHKSHTEGNAYVRSVSCFTFYYLRTEKLITQWVIMPLSVYIVVKPIQMMITYVNEHRYNTLHSTLPSVNIIVYAL